MQALKLVRIATSVSQVEMPAVDLASKLMRESMRDVVKQDIWSIQIETHKLGGAQKLKQQPSAVVCSMLQEVTSAPKDTKQIEMNWRAYLEQLRAFRAPIYIFNVFRHVDEAGSDGGVSPTMERIRRINRLLVDLAHDFRAAVIDVDGILADEGGGNLRADFRLGSRAAIKRVGYITALALLSGPLGENSNVYAQQQAIELLRRRGMSQRFDRSTN